MPTIWWSKGRVRNSAGAADTAALTYLLARFLRFLQPHPPLIVQFHRHAAAAVGVLADPAEELLEFPPQRGVLLAALRVARAALQLLWEETGRGETKEVRRCAGEVWAQVWLFKYQKKLCIKENEACSWPDCSVNIWNDSYKFRVLFRSSLDNQTEQGWIETLPSEGLILTGGKTRSKQSLLQTKASIPIFSPQSKTLKYAFHLFVPNLSDCVIKTNKVTLSYLNTAKPKIQTEL